jgi:hypothetical protein
MRLRPLRTLHPSMTKKLIISKINLKDSEKRPLCLAISRVILYLEDNYEQEYTRLECIETLAAAAVKKLDFSDLCDLLSILPDSKIEQNWIRQERLTDMRSNAPKWQVDRLTPGSDDYVDTAPQDALIYAIATNRTNLAFQLLQSGVDPMIKSAAFGIPLEAAAYWDAQTILDKILRDTTEHDKKATDTELSRVGRARGYALRGAARAGHMHISRMILEDHGDQKQCYERGFSRAIALAVENGHEDIALLVLKQRPLPDWDSPNLGDRRLVNRRELRFWWNVIRKAKKHQCEMVEKVASEGLERHWKRRGLGPSEGN